MFTSNLTRFLALGSLALGLFTTAYAEKINPTRVGPVSQYGQLQAGTNNAGEGRIYGSCEHFRSSGNEVQVKGMSLFWSCAANQQRYWKKDIITGLVERQNIQLIRAAMAVDDMGDWADGHYFTKPDFYQAMLDEAVEAAIENDIYVIIDFHSHVAADSVENAKAFFRTQAQKWGSYDNVIFEVFNEPICASGSVGDNSDCSEYGGYIGMAAIKTYADQVVSVIREYSDNLIIVGTPMWDQQPNQAINYRVEDPLENDNIAYAFHYYAGRSDGDKAHGFSLSSNADKAMQSGLSVFVSEWGTVGYDGAGAPSTELNPQWQNWMNSKKISSANWNAGISGDPSSVSGSEYFAYSFDPDNAPDNWTYSTSGQWVNANVFNDLPATYTACDDYVPASSSSSGGISSSSGGSGIYTLMPVYDYAYAGGGWTVANPEGEWGTETTVYDDEMGGNFWGLKNVNTEEEGGYAGVGMNISNLNGCQVLSYQYIGIGHNLTFANTSDGEDVLAEWEIPSSNTWTTHTFNMSSLSGINLERELDIKWQVSGGENGNLYIKDIQCIKDGNYSSSSSGDEPASSSSGVELPVVAAPTTNTELFDDFEDGDYYPLWDGIGQWWTETDVVGGGGSSNAELSFVKGSASAKALQMSYSLDVGGYPWGSPYVTISTNDFANMNLSQCTEVRYDYKGAAHKFRLKVSSKINNLLDMGWGFPTFAVTSPSESWQTVTIPVASLRQEWTGLSGNWVGIETVLPYANGFDWRVEGEDESDKSSGTLAIDNIRCVGLAETQYYEITFKNGDEDYEVKDWAAGSNVPDPAGTPSKTPDAQFTYEFDHWTWGEDEWGYPTRLVTGKATYEAVYNYVTNTYTVTFLMDDGVTPVENGVVENVDYGTDVMEIVPADPSKAADAQFTYIFDGWDPAITNETIVMGDVSYKATFTTITNMYSVAFVDDDETPLKDAVEYPYGTPVDQIDVPVVGDKGALKFAGWDPGLAPVTRSVIYKALYTDKIVITWKDDDGSVLKTQFYDGGETPCYAGENVDLCTDEVPTKEGNAEWSYTFAGWSPDVVAVNGDATYTASYTSIKNTYAVTFYDEDGVTKLTALSEGPYEYGTNVSGFAPTPTKVATAEYTYTFAGWTPAITDETIVTGTASYTATYTATKNQYTVEFVMDDGVTPAATSVTRGYGTEIASLLPSDPTKAPTAAKTYEFDRWVVKVSDTQDQELEAGATLRAGMTLKAVFKEFDRKYLITFVDYDNTPRWDGGTFYVYGTAAADIAQPAPTRDPDDEFTYTFAGWTPAVTDVTGEQVYKATYTPTALGATTYTITFTGDADVTGIPSPTVAAEGASIATLLASVADPTKTSTVAKDYLFAGWVIVVDDETTAPIAAGATLTGDLTLKAVFTENDREYTVTFVGEEGVTGLPDAATVEYGVKVSTLLPTTNPTKGQTAQYTYSFSKWMIVDGNTMYDWTANTTVEGDMTLMAQFTSKARTYTITFVNGDKSETKVELVYDAMPEAPEAKLPANTAQYTYSFVAWEPAIAKVTGNKTYTAKINAVLNEYKITFLNYDNTELQSSNVKYGETPEYKGATPTKNPSATHTYTFDGWTPQVAAVTGVASYTAIFREEKIPVASSSSEVIVSSSSETIVVSSSATTVVSSSSVKPASSSSVQNKSSSSTKPASSSSSIKDKPKSSSSSKTDALYPTIAGGVKTIYANNELRISVAGTSPVKVQVFDMMGNLKESYQGVSAGEHVVSLSHLNRGNYIVRITGTGTLRNMKVSVR